jgi:8-oxo-dGTP diphosphatase
MSTAPVPESQAATSSDGQHPDGAVTLSHDQVNRRLAEVMDAAGAASGTDRTRIIVIRGGRLAAIERFRQGRHYWVLPGGGVEEGETIAQGAVREAAEELGIPVRLGTLRAIVHGRDASGRRTRHWCFDAAADSDDIMVAGGPEASGPPEWGTYKAVWLSLDRLEPQRMWPPALAELVAAGGGKWPAGITQIIEP